MPAETVNNQGVGTDIEQWWRSGETMTYRGRTVNDYYPAFNRALENYDAVVSPEYNRTRGFTLLFGPGDYHFSNTPTLIRGMRLLGQGGHWQNGTTFRYADGIDGLHARFRDSAVTLPISPGGGRGRGDMSVVENITFVGSNPRSQLNPGPIGNHGIWALAPIRISNCHIIGWGGNGIRLTSAPATLEEGFTEGAWSSSTNLSLVEHSTVQLCGWRGVLPSSKRHDTGIGWEDHVSDEYCDGIYIEGGNSNGSLFSAVHSTANGRWGFYDASNTGCTFVACMTHGNGVVKGDGPDRNLDLKLPHGGSYKAVDPPDGAKIRSVFIGCYAESDQRPAELTPLTLVFGGGMTVDPSQGQYFRNDAFGVLQLERGVTVTLRGPGHDTVKATLGGGVGVAFQAVNEGNPHPLNLSYDDVARTWAWRRAFGDAKHMVFGTTGDTRVGTANAIGIGPVYFPAGILLGHGNVPQIHLKNELRSAGRLGNIQGIVKTQYVRNTRMTPSDVEKTIFEGYASEAPGLVTIGSPPQPVVWNVGDVLWNLNPGPGEWMGWVCTEATIPGTPPTAAVWSRFGPIESTP